MEHIIVADAKGTELRDLKYSGYDIEVGEEENSFQIEIRREEFEHIPEKARIYIPGTEYGGLFRRIETNTELGLICPGGLTWRGMMRHRIISPPSGQDYATDTGELNAIIKARVEAAFPGLFVGSSESTGMTVSGFRYDRYCPLDIGLGKLLKSVGYRMNIEYSQVEKAVMVSAVPIMDYSEDIEFSSDMQINYLMQMQNDGVNHLICLGMGELKNRTVYHLYIDKNGNIGNTQYYKGNDEITEVYDYTGAELPDLIQGGIEHLQEVRSQNVFEMKIAPETDIPIGDIVGGRDYLSGMSMKAPIAGKVLRWEEGEQTIEYTFASDAMIEIEDVSLSTESLASASVSKRNLLSGIELEPMTNAANVAAAVNLSEAGK